MKSVPIITAEVASVAMELTVYARKKEWIIVNRWYRKIEAASKSPSDDLEPIFNAIHKLISFSSGKNIAATH